MLVNWRNIWGPSDVPSPDLPLVDDKGTIMVAPVAILQPRVISRTMNLTYSGSFTGWTCRNRKQFGRMHRLSGRFFHPSIREVKDANIRRGLLSGTLKLLQLLSLHSPFSKQRRKPIQWTTWPIPAIPVCFSRSFQFDFILKSWSSTRVVSFVTLKEAESAPCGGVDGPVRPRWTGCWCTCLPPVQVFLLGVPWRHARVPDDTDGPHE